MRPRNARILRELIDVAVRRTEVHPGITAFVLFSKEGSIRLDRSSLRAALTSSTRKPATGPVVK